MARRFEGFVVGKQTVRQQKGWKIGRRTHNGKVNYFAPETEIVEGFEVFAGAEVTFSTETRDGRPFALNVQPKTATQMEDSMRNMKLGLIAALILVIVALVGIFKPHHQEPIRGWIVEMRAERMLNSIRTLTADQLITSEVVRAAVRGAHGWGPGSRSSSWAAREAVFMANQCQIFSVGFDRTVEDMCLPAGMALYYEGTTHGEWVEENKGIPARLLTDFFPQARAAIYETARNYLMTPANVRAVYEAKRDVAIDEFRQLSDEDKQAFLRILNAAIASFEQFRDDESARVKYAHYIRLENAWRADESDSLDPFRAWRDAGATLHTAVTDESFYLFAGRRHAEGGDQLISAYIEIMRDLASQLNG